MFSIMFLCRRTSRWCQKNRVFINFIWKFNSWRIYFSNFNL